MEAGPARCYSPRAVSERRPARAGSSAGRAAPLQGVGRRFEPSPAHHLTGELQAGDFAGFLYFRPAHQGLLKNPCNTGVAVIPAKAGIYLYRLCFSEDVPADEKACNPACIQTRLLWIPSNPLALVGSDTGMTVSNLEGRQSLPLEGSVEKVPWSDFG